MRAWITDGSPVPFEDIVSLPASHPTPFGPVRYKGSVDEAVPVGECSLAMNDADRFVPEAEWCITFPGGIEPFSMEPDRFSGATSVVFQGMIEGKWLNRLVGGLVWRPASIGNNLIAVGAGITTTLDEVEAGRADGHILIQYECAAGVRTQSSSLDDLRGHNVLELVRAVLRHCRDKGYEIEAVNCSARGADAALADDPEFLMAALAAAGVKKEDLAAPAGWQRVISTALPIVEERRLAALSGSVVKLSVRSNNATVGTGQLALS